MDFEENRQRGKGRVLVRMDDVCLRRGDSPVLDHVDWTIREGEHWGVLGDSGSGKSLLIDALTRRIPLLAGTIRYCFDAATHPVPFPSPGEISTFSSEDCRRFLAGRLGYIQARWESSAQLQATTARHVLDTGHDSLLLKNLGIDRLLDRPVISLSSGEFRKFMLARALLASPRLLVLEDPFSGLDQESGLELRDFLESLCRQAIPAIVLLISQPEHLLDGISRLVVVQDYRVVRMGPTAAADRAHTPRTRRIDTRSPRDIHGISGRRHEPSSETIIEMKDVAVRYGDNRILEGVNWTVKEGENWAILGPNGAGKSTLLSLVTADNPQAYVNDIRLFGRRRGSGETIWDIRRQIGSVSPELQLCYPAEATALEVVCSGLFDSVGLYRACSSEQEDRANDWLEILGSGGIASRAFWSLSSAEQRLVLLARALIKQPRLLVLDEPCLGLDRFHVMRFLRQVENLSRNRLVLQRRGVSMQLATKRRVTQPPLTSVPRFRSTTVLYVTHRPDELPATTSHVMRLERGKIVSIEALQRD